MILDCQTSDKTIVSEYGEAGGGIEWERGSSNHKSLSYTKCIKVAVLQSGKALYSPKCLDGD